MRLAPQARKGKKFKAKAGRASLSNSAASAFRRFVFALIPLPTGMFSQDVRENAGVPTIESDPRACRQARPAPAPPPRRDSAFPPPSAVRIEVMGRTAGIGTRMIPQRIGGGPRRKESVRETRKQVKDAGARHPEEGPRAPPVTLDRDGGRSEAGVPDQAGDISLPGTLPQGKDFSGRTGPALL